ncbi:MAG TPA: histidine kinase N-terminal 7TM domain-containing protein [Anaerolineae bacterium]|nr:histidine kinase N-terminal 7TM domain-containing protein [Anaerolineae bacterium]HOR00535.1 histidine kinase N-terminal 7TM domain-containing protein [Anaerolineae bacterium]
MTTGLISGALAFYILRQRPAPGNVELALLLAAVGEWALALTPEAMATTVWPKFVWSAVAYVGTTTAPVFLFLYAVRRAQLDHWLTPRRTLGLFAIPLITTALAASNEWHHLIWSQITLTTSWAGVSAVYGRGPWFWVNVAYGYLLVFSGLLTLLWAALRLPHLYSLQTRILFAASLVPIVGNAVYISNPHAVAGVDPTPAALMCTGLLLTLGIQRYRLLELVPLARAALFADLQDGVLFLDARRQVLDLNPAAQRLLELTPGAIGQPAESALAAWPPLVALLAAGAEAHAEVQAQDGEPRDLDLRLSHLHDAQGQAAGWLVVVRDVTGLHRAEAERLKMERRLLRAQKAESLGVLAGGIAHDFNNLLTSISGNLELAMPHLAPASPALANLEEATRAARRAAALTAQMLAYSGKGNFALRSVDLSGLVAAMMPLLRASIARSIALTFHPAHELPAIMADLGQVEQVVMNLTSNAVEAIGDAAGAISLATSARVCEEAELQQSYLDEKPAAGRFVCLEVSDTGCGMDEETRQRLFEPFFSTKFAGRGLGMAAVLGIVRGHRGAITVESAAGRGTTVRVLFSMPSEPAVAPPAPAPAPAVEAPRPHIASDPATILIVDDEEMVRTLCRRMVERLGYRALTAAGGHEAVAVLREHPEVACAIVDLTMPKMDGLATLAELRRAVPGFPVILSSGYEQGQIGERLQGRGVAAFIHKPYGLEGLREALEKVLNPCSS